MPPRRPDIAETHWHEAAPARRLEGLVSRYVGYRDEGDAVVTRSELPSASVTLIISLGPSMRVAAAPASELTEVTSFLAGLWTSPTRTEQSGDQRGLQVDLTPLGAYSLLGVPMHELANGLVALDAVLGPDASRLAERLAGLGDWDSRFALADDFLSRNIARGPVPSPEIAWVWRALKSSAGRVSIRQMADTVGWSAPRLVERSRRELGLAPKPLARVVRFQSAVHLLASPGRPTLGQVAVDCGYYDQSHLCRDFAEMAGASPGEFARSTSA